MRVLVIGSGGREHALCWAIAASPLLTKLYCAPGNAGIAREAECVAIGADDSDALLDFCKREKIDLVVVGPEAPLVAGLANRLRAEGIRTFGPDAAAAQLEGSKGFSKDICAKYNIPTAAYRRFTEAGAAKAYIREMGAPIVVKADGLAAGKGVTVAMTEEEAIAAVDAAMTDGAFGAAGAELVIEECMVGEELSFFALADGETALPLASAQDHKRVGDGDTGPNTGGMGAYSPAPVCTPELERRIIDEILTPTVEAMKAEGAPFKGVLFIGLMITEEGPKVIEYNVRFGDPECQVLMMRLQSDILPALIATADGTLKNFDLRWQPKAAMTVVLASDGYPGTYQKGTVIRNVDGAEADPDVTVFHAGTARNDAGDLIATGGRVLNVTAVGDTVGAARDSAYAAVDLIQWPEGFCRRDIGHRALD
ncbi:phosphoribosylamine--glycine ligase [Pacificispira sp.]|uniref:phosphoribosylamine--glycine ligase n=1 Tax=Pacificispira sp. TaxID=2888761 RepID=UPI003BA89E5C